MTDRFRSHVHVALWVGSFLGALWGALALAADPKSAADALEKDYQEELPRIAPLEPAQALATFHVAPGFRIEQVAAEPLVVDPVAMAFDENGQLFVVEMRDYSEQAEERLGRIRLLEDTDEDGRFDRSHIFAEQLSWPTALICYDGGILVGAAPDILYLKDTDGDHRADVQKVLFTGFGRSNVQGLLNTFQWGLDHRIHGATSSSGAEVIATEHPEREPLVLRGRDFAIEPRTWSMEPTSGGGQHGMSFNRWGEKFVCSNSDHVQFILMEDRYLARNPYLSATVRISIAADGPQADVYRTSPVEPWRVVRTRLRRQGLVPGPVERGGLAAGYFTGATGVTIYQGHAWPDMYYGWAIIGDVGSNLIHRKRLDPDGIGYIARRVDEQSELVTSDDIWFRPVQFANAPDGTLYVADMYREVIEHPHSLPPIIKQHLDLTSGRDRGRIYRIVPESFQQPTLPRLGEASTAELVRTLDHPNGWHRETAARLLYERQDQAAVKPLEELARMGQRPEGRLRALYAIEGLGSLNASLLVDCLSDPHPRVRQHALRLSERLLAEYPALQEKVLQCVADESLHVRYQLAFTLGEMSGPRRNRALADLLRTAPENVHLQVAVQSSLATGAGDVLSLLITEPKLRDSSSGEGFLASLAAQIGKQQRPDDVAAVLALLRDHREDTKLVSLLLQHLAPKPGSPLEQQIASATGGRSDQVLAQMLDEATQLAANQQLEVAQRTGAIHLLQLGTFDQAEKILSDLLDPQEPVEVQQAAIDALSSFEAPQVARILIERAASLSPQLRRQALEVLLSRTGWVLQLLVAIEQGRIARGDLQPGRLELLREHPDPEVRERARSVLAGQETGKRTEVLQAYRGVLEQSGDVARGREVFRRACASCHQLEGHGHAVGPSIAAMRARGPEAILVNVLDPNREVNPQFVNFTLQTQDGRVLTGMLAAETSTSVTLQRADGVTETVLRVEIDQLRSTGVSLMPEGLEQQIDPQQMADLLTYLMNAE